VSFAAGRDRTRALARPALRCARVVVKLGPALAAADTSQVAERLLRRLDALGAGAAIAARFSRDAGTVRVVHGEPALTAGAKLPGVVRWTAS